MTSYLWQGLKIVLWALLSGVFRYGHCLRVIGTYVPCWGYCVRWARACAQLCLLCSNFFVRLGQHTVPVV
jgi:hypothetical protein